VTTTAVGWSIWNGLSSEQRGLLFAGVAVRLIMNSCILSRAQSRSESFSFLRFITPVPQAHTTSESARGTVKCGRADEYSAWRALAIRLGFSRLVKEELILFLFHTRRETQRVLVRLLQTHRPGPFPDVSAWLTPTSTRWRRGEKKLSRAIHSSCPAVSTAL